MLVKLTAKNQVTLPAKALRALPRTEYFEASIEKGTIVLRPVQMRAAVGIDAIRDRLASAGLTELDVQKAVRWARRTR